MPVKDNQKEAEVNDAMTRLLRQILEVLGEGYVPNICWNSSSRKFTGRYGTAKISVMNALGVGIRIITAPTRTSDIVSVSAVVPRTSIGTYVHLDAGILPEPIEKVRTLDPESWVRVRSQVVEPYLVALPTILSRLREAEEKDAAAALRLEKLSEQVGPRANYFGTEKCLARVHLAGAGVQELRYSGSSIGVSPDGGMSFRSVVRVSDLIEYLTSDAAKSDGITELSVEINAKTSGSLMGLVNMLRAR